MTDYSENRITNRDGLSLYYRIYGEDRPGVPIVCLPGISRNCRDFHDVALHMASSRPVVTMDFRGRGQSDYDPDWQRYQPGTYPADVLEILDAIHYTRVVFFGTSLGGLVSMLIAHADAKRVAAVILNDIGPEIGSAGLARIKGYIGKAPPVANWDEAVSQAKATYGVAWPGLSDEEWLEQVRRAYRESDDGIPVLDMDPMVGEAARTVTTELVDPWELFESLRPIPTLLLHGEHSDILTFDIVEKMLAKKPDLRHVVVRNRGHVPILDEPEVLSALAPFLQSLDA